VGALVSEDAGEIGTWFAGLLADSKIPLAK
jgi:hypothetical protein